MFFKSEKFKDAVDMLSATGTIGLHLVTATFVGFGMGWWLDKAMFQWFGLETKPWLMLGFLVLGIVAGFMMVYEDARKLQAMDNRKKSRAGRAATNDGDEGRGEDGDHREKH